MKIRFPVVAGSWYAGTRESLKKQIEECFNHSLGPGKIPEVKDGPRQILALICPHAGYIYSGPIAAHSYRVLAMDGARDSAIILGPNHTGIGSGVSIMIKGVWKTPLGDLEIDSDLANAITEATDIVDIDEKAHRVEHSIEMQIPFLQFLYDEAIKFVPICMMLQDLETSREVGEAIARASKERNVIIIATTDLTHYEPDKRARRLDAKALDAILKLDETILQRRIIELGLSMCGYGPVSAALVAAKELGARRAKLLKYATTGEITGDRSSVVGYSSIKISLI
jgi:hypothetical protein